MSEFSSEPSRQLVEHGAQEGSIVLPKMEIEPMNESLLSFIANSVGEKITPIAELANNKKSSVWLAEYANTKVVLKSLITTDQFYTQTFVKELLVYSCFRSTDPGLGVPKVIFVSKDPPVLITEYLEGKPIARDRYPTEDEWKVIKIESLLAVFEGLRRYPGYPLGTANEAIQRYYERWDKYIARGVYADSDKLILDKLAKNCLWQPEFNHGDPIPANILESDSKYNLIDWEFGGAYVPLYDCAVLWAIAARCPEIQRTIENQYLFGTCEDKFCFAANVLNVASRELWIHMELPDGHAIKNERLELLTPLLHKARAIVSHVLNDEN